MQIKEKNRNFLLHFQWFNMFKILIHKDFFKIRIIAKEAEQNNRHFFMRLFEKAAVIYVRKCFNLIVTSLKDQNMFFR